jgi:hypothetical protein
MNWENVQLTAKTSDPSPMTTVDADRPVWLPQPASTTSAIYTPPTQSSRLVGYAGHVPKIQARNIFGRTFQASQDVSH